MVVSSSDPTCFGSWREAKNGSRFSRTLDVTLDAKDHGSLARHNASGHQIWMAQQVHCGGNRCHWNFHFGCVRRCRVTGNVPTCQIIANNNHANPSCFGLFQFSIVGVGADHVQRHLHREYGSCGGTISDRWWLATSPSPASHSPRKEESQCVVVRSSSGCGCGPRQTSWIQL